MTSHMRLEALGSSEVLEKAHNIFNKLIEDPPLAIH